MKFCKALEEENKEAALSAELTHGQKKKHWQTALKRRPWPQRWALKGVRGFWSLSQFCSPHNKLGLLHDQYCSYAQHLSQSHNCPSAQVLLLDGDGIETEVTTPISPDKVGGAEELYFPLFWMTEWQHTSDPWLLYDFLAFQKKK